MTTLAIANTTLKRGAIALLGVLLALSLMMPAPSANAQTSEELQAQIDQLLAVIAQLQAQIGDGGTVIGSCDSVWARNLGIGSTGADVRALQQFLNRDADTRLALSGAGSSGMETQYYGPITAAAVSKFQVKYRAEILTPLGLVNPTGYFGNSSRAQANQLCADVTIPDPDDDDDDDDGGALEGGEASLENFEVNGEDTSLSEGDEEGEVMTVEFDVEDGDAEVNRIDVAFDHVSGGDDDPWDVFDSIAIMADGDTVAEMDLGDEDEWSEDDPENGDYSIRLTDIDDFVVREGETAEFTVALSVAGSVDDADTGVDWEIFIPDDGIRATDSLNINHYIGETDDTVSFDIDEEGGEDELTVRSSNEDPDATTLQLDSDDTSDWLTVFAFELDSDDSENDIEISSLPIDVEFSTSTYETLVNDARLVIDGEEYDDFTVSDEDNATTTLTFDFDNDDLVIDSGGSATVELQIEFRALEDADLEGATFEASVDGDDIDAEGADDLDDNQTGGSAASEEHTLRTSGIISELVSVDSDSEDGIGTFTFEVDLTAFEDPMFIDTDSGDNNDGDGFDWSVIGGTVTTSATVQTDADVESGFYRIDEGETETFTVVVTVDPTTAGSYYVILDDVNYNDTAAAADATHEFTPESQYDSQAVSISAS